MKDNKLYNPNQKQAFIDIMHTEASRRKATNIFNLASAMEREYAKDLAEFDSELLGAFLSKYCGIGSQTLPAYKALIRSYYDWSYKNGYTQFEKMPEPVVDKTEKIRKEMVANPKQLESIFNRCFDPVEERTIDCIYRCFYWFAFSGMLQNDALEVVNKDVDFNNMRIIHNDIEYELYRECLPAFRSAVELDCFKYVHPKYVLDKRPRVDCEYVLRGFRKGKPTITSLRPEIGKRLSQKGVTLSYSNVRLSGIYYRIYEAERSGEKINFQFEAQNFARGSTSTGKKLEMYVKNIARSLYTDYEAWKKAFQI